MPGVFIKSKARRGFKTRTGAMNMRSHRWVCLKCRAQHEKKPLRENCPGCNTVGMLQYFSSKAEALRYAELMLLHDHGQITNLTLQPVYPIIINGVKICEYRGDFLYRNKEGEEVLEDVKGTNNTKGLDPVFKLKKKMVMAQYGKEISIHVRK